MSARIERTAPDEPGLERRIAYGRSPSFGAAARARSSAGGATTTCDVERLGPRPQDADRLGMRVRVDEDEVAVADASRRCGHSVTASAAAVPSSRSDAFAISMPVRSQIAVWKLISASSRPWAISGWYGV